MKKFMFVVLASMMAAGFAGCSDDKAANGDACEKAADCKSDFCNADKVCADKPAATDKKANGAECSNADECNSGFCGDDKKCADEPVATDKKANGAECANADECKSGFCGDDKKCADKPDETKEMTDDEFKAAVKKHCEEHAEQIQKPVEECISEGDELIQSAQNVFPKCKDGFYKMYVCSFNATTEDGCDAEGKVYEDCMKSNYPDADQEETSLEEEYMTNGKKFCEDEFKDAQEDNDPDNDEKTVEGCLADLEDMVKEQKEKYPKCLDEFYNGYICSFKNPEDGDTKCKDINDAWEKCYEDNYPNE